MFCRLRTNRRSSLYLQADEERLLPAIELYEYPTNTITDASPLVHHALELDRSAFKRKHRIHTHELISLDRIRRVAASINLDKLGNYLDCLTERPQQRLRSQRILLRDGEEEAFCDAVETSSETLFKQGQGEGRLWRVKRGSGLDTGLRSTINWYFWSPEAGKNCPSLEFILMHLAPSHIWL